MQFSAERVNAQTTTVEETEEDDATLPPSREETGMRKHRSVGSLWEKCDFSDKSPKLVAPVLFLTPDVVFSWTQHAKLWPILLVYSS